MQMMNLKVWQHEARSCSGLWLSGSGCFYISCQMEAGWTGCGWAGCCLFIYKKTSQTELSPCRGLQLFHVYNLSAILFFLTMISSTPSLWNSYKHFCLLTWLASYEVAVFEHTLTYSPTCEWAPVFSVSLFMYNELSGLMINCRIS